MAEVKISELTSATTPLAGTETVPIVQGGVTKKVAVSAVIASKQDTLVSGTNIKTINGSSVLGSGNLTISGGGIHANLKPIGSGASVFTNAALTDGIPSPSSIAADQIMLIPFIPVKDIAYTGLSCFSFPSGNNFRILVYSNVNDLPNTKIFESSNLSAATIGYKTAMTSGTFLKNTCYWIGVYADSSCTLECYPLSTLLSISNSIGYNCNYASISQVFGSAPSVITASNVTFARTNIPIVQIS